METSAGFRLLAVLLLAALSFTQAQTVEKYFKDGGTLVLKPVLVSGQMTTIVWKHNRDLLAEWVKDLIELTYYSKFNGRSQLNTNTGVLEISDMTAADFGVYSVEISNQGQSQVYQAEKTEEVPQPVVTVRPPVCNSTSKICTLSCDGDIKGAEPVEYFWKKGDGEWERSEKFMEIFNNEEIQLVTNFTCRTKNPLSEKESKPVLNQPFEIKPAESGHWISVLGIVMRSLVILVLFAVVVNFLWHKYKKKR